MKLAELASAGSWEGVTLTIETEDQAEMHVTIQALVTSLADKLQSGELKTLRCESLQDAEVTARAAGGQTRVVRREAPTYVIRVNGGAPAEELRRALRMVKQHGYTVSGGPKNGEG